MQAAFDHIYDLILEFRDYLGTGVITDERVEEWCGKLRDPIRAFVSVAKRHERQDLDSFIEANMGQIYRFHESLVGVYAKTYMNASQISKCRSHHDSIMQNVFAIKRPSKRFQHMPTKLFNQLVRGITYFSTEPVVEQPIYHREASCGSSTLDYITKFVNRHHIHTADALERCYIERLIYDAIYVTIYYKQDIGHLQELRNIERLYQEKNKGITITVNIRFDNLIFPADLKITWTKAWDKSIVETYSKDKLDGRVTCKRVDTMSGTSIIKYKKIQDFHNKREWVQV